MREWDAWSTYWQFDGKDWKAMGWPRLHKKAWGEGQPAIYEDRL